MDRLDEIRDYLKAFQNRWIAKKVRECAGQPEEELLEKTEQVLSDAKERFCFLCLFHFRSSLVEGAYEYWICALGKMMYLQPPIAQGIWVPQKLYEDVPDLRRETERELRKRFIRLQTYEVEEGVRGILEEYQKLAEVYWFEAAQRAAAGERFRSAPKEEEWKILSGSYMGSLKIVLQP